MPTNWKKAAREVHKRKKHSERGKTAHVTIFRRNKRIIETTTTSTGMIQQVFISSGNVTSEYAVI